MMLFKIFFLSVIIFSSVGIGNVIIRDKEERIRILTCLQKGGHALQGTMVMEGRPLIEALYAAERASGTGLYSRMAEGAAKDPGLSGRNMVSESAKAMKETLTALKAPEIEIMSDFIARVSSAVSADQITDAATLFSRQMYTLITDLSKEHAKKEKAIRALCLCMGLAAAIILA